MHHRIGLSSLFPLACTVLAAAAAGQTWRQAAPAASPPARSGHGMATDTLRERVVVFGGYHWTQDLHYQDTWEFDGQTWNQVASPAAPSPRRLPGMCYDRQIGAAVLFGGMFGGTFSTPTYFGDTWHHDGTGWHAVTPAGPSPTPRVVPMAYDAARGVVVLFGGFGNTAPYTYTDTWEYDGVVWTQRTPATTSPPAHTSWAMAFDERRGVAVAHQGYVFGNPTPMQTWQWDGQDWARVVTPTYPPTLVGAAMTWDPRREVVVLVGAGYAGDTETWLFDGVDWQLDAAATIPNTRSGHALAYDDSRAAFVLFGGDVSSGAFIVESNQTWQLATWAGFTQFGAGCAATGPAPVLFAPGGAPESGTTMTSRVGSLPAGSVPILILGNSDTNWQGAPLPLDLGAIGLPGCDLRVSVELAFLLVNLGGQADWSFAVPADPMLHGATFFEQALVFDAAWQAEAVSTAAALTVGL
ncbi:MAG TPA: kelch repeat-containing protein [Planctomycetota bacterium]|nr:kelch repeat-containing protein [Planctomycetota bacterium]